jgi:hydroxypyruvate isomerase
VEFLFPYEAWPAERSRAAEAQRPDAGAAQPAAGDWARASAASPAIPDRVDEFRAGVAQAIEYATGAGRAAAQLPGRQGAGGRDDAARAPPSWQPALCRGRAEEAGLKLLIEPINTFDIPGFWLNRTAQAIALIDEVGADNLFVQYDIYHAQRMEGELAATLSKHLAAHRPHPAGRQPGPQRAGHGRDQLPLPVRHLDRIGYTGWIGCEYKPAHAHRSRPGLARRSTPEPPVSATASTSNDKNMKLGFIGLGIMGAPMAGHLLAAGHSCSCTRAAGAAGLPTPARWPAPAPPRWRAPADIVFTMVPDTPDVEKVLFGERAWPKGLARARPWST